MSPPREPPPGVKVLTVAELTQQIKNVLEEGFENIWVTGEVSNIARPNSGHLYFTLKESNAQIRAVMWRATCTRIKFDLRDGLEVIACGRLTVYPPRGEYQLQIEQLQPKGIGALELAFRQLREKLLLRGYFQPERKKPLPAYPRCLALVTSPTGAAVRDMLEILGRRWPLVEVVVCPVRVQGDGAAQEIATAIRLLNLLHNGRHLVIDVMIVGRGGGSLEDLWPFNEECVATAIYESLIPVVSGVGHEIDVTIADLVADRRALTPSEAAEIVVPDMHKLHDELCALEIRLRDLLLARLERAKQRLADLAERREFRRPLERIRDFERKLDEWSERLGRAVQLRLARARTQLEAQAGRLESLSPLNVLARGYSLTRTETERAVVRSPSQVRRGDRIITRVQHGEIVSRVEETQAGVS